MRRATDGASLDIQLLELAIPLCQQAERLCPRTGPGRKPDFADWKITAMIVLGVLHKKKSKSAQYRFVCSHAPDLKAPLQLSRIPARSTFFDRYQRLGAMVQKAIELQGRVGLREHVADASVVAADKSLLPARGPEWNQCDRKRGRIPKYLKGIDTDADWGCSVYNGWVFGYSFEVVVTAQRKSVVFPLLASVDVASAKEQKTFAEKIDCLPGSMRTALADPGYDSNDTADRIEMDRHCRVRRPRRHFVCPPQKGFVSQIVGRGRRERQRQRRQARLAFLRSRRGRSLYALRKQTIEPFNGTFKALFELDDHVWHRGLSNNRTCILSAIFAYQLLLRYHWRQGYRDAQIRYLLDSL